MHKPPDVENIRLQGLRPSVFQTRCSRRGRIPRLEDAWRFAFQPEIFNLWHLCKKSIDKEWLREQFKLMDAQTGFVMDYNVTPQQLRASMIADGVRPEDNIASRELFKMRYEEQ